MKYLKLFEDFTEKFDNDLIDSKMTELRKLIDSISDGQNIVYEWENKNDHQILVNFTTEEDSIRYEFDVDDLFVVKIIDDIVNFREDVESIEDGLDIIESDIHSVLGLSESYRGQYSSSIEWNNDDLNTIINDIVRITELNISENSSDIEDLIGEMERKLSSIYDDIIVEDVVDKVLFYDPSIVESSYIKDKLREEIIQMGDNVMNHAGTEPNQVLFAFEDAIDIVKKYYQL